jgi:hypothetical protein
MPLPHDHKKAKADKTAAFKKRKEEATKSGKSSAAKKSKPEQNNLGN